jgi:hypothetical protein
VSKEGLASREGLASGERLASSGSLWRIERGEQLERG